MRLLMTDSFKVLRASKGNEGYDDGKGNWVGANQTTNQFTIKGSVQPLSGADMRLLPEAFKSTSILKIYTKTKLQTVDQDTNTQADTLIIGDKRYQVQVVENWRQLHTSHYKVIVGREEKT